MKITENKVTDYSSANFTENETLWSATPTVYDNGDTARFGHIIYKYAGISGTNSESDPSIDTNDWLEFKTSNYYAMLGERTKDQTINPNSIIIEIAINRFDVIALLNIEATSVQVEVLGESFNTTIDTQFREVFNYTAFFFEPFIFEKNVFVPIPFYGNATARITVNNIGGDAKVGRLVAGRSLDLGLSLFGASFDLESYSRIDTDEFGTTTLIHRDAVYNGSYDIQIPSQNIERLKIERKRLDAIPILFIGDDSENSVFQNLLSYGTWQGANMTLQNPTFSNMNLTIKELL